MKSAVSLLLVVVLCCCAAAQTEPNEPQPSTVHSIGMAIANATPDPAQIQREAAIHPLARDLIVSFEVIGQSYYNRKLQGIICPGLHSGPTWAIGYDGGHQTKATIAADWSNHAQSARLAMTSGVIGQAECSKSAHALSDVRVHWDIAVEVFDHATLWTYRNRARNAMGKEVFDGLHPIAQGAWVSTVYNRGASLRGTKRTQMAVIANVCAPARDYQCMAVQYRAMPSIWIGTSVHKGLERRYIETAKLVESIGKDA